MTWLDDTNTSFICSQVAQKRRLSVIFLLKVCVISTYSVLRLKNLNLSRGAECWLWYTNTNISAFTVGVNTFTSARRNSVDKTLISPRICLFLRWQAVTWNPHNLRQAGHLRESLNHCVNIQPCQKFFLQILVLIWWPDSCSSMAARTTLNSSLLSKLELANCQRSSVQDLVASNNFCILCLLRPPACDPETDLSPPSWRVPKILLNQGVARRQRPAGGVSFLAALSGACDTT